MDLFSKTSSFPRKHHRCISLESGQTLTKKSCAKTPLDAVPRFFPRRYSTPELAMRKHALCRLHRDDCSDRRGHPISNKSCQTDILGLDKYLQRSRPSADADFPAAASYKRPSSKKKPKVRSVAVHCERRRLTFAAFKGYQKFKHVYKRKVSLPPPPSSAAPSPLPPSSAARSSTSADDCRRRNGGGGMLPKLRPDRTTETELRPAGAAVKLPMIPGAREAKPDCCSRSDDGGATRLAKLQQQQQQQTRPQSTGSGGAATGSDAVHRELARFRASSAPKVDSPRSYWTWTGTPPSPRQRQQLQSTTPESSSDTADTALDVSSVQQQTAAATTATSSTGTRTVSTCTTFAAEPVFPIVFSCESVLRHPLDGGYVSHTESHRFSVHYAPAADVDAPAAVACSTAADDRDDGTRSPLQAFASANDARQNERCPSADDSVSSGAAAGRPDDHSAEWSSAVRVDGPRPRSKNAAACEPTADGNRDRRARGNAVEIGHDGGTGKRDVNRAFGKAAAAAAAVQLMSTTADSRRQLGEHRGRRVKEEREEEKKDDGERREKNGTEEQQEEKGDALLERRARTEHTPLLRCDERSTQNRRLLAVNCDRTVSNQSPNVDGTATTSRTDWKPPETAPATEFGDSVIVVTYAEPVQSTSADGELSPRELRDDNAAKCFLNVPTDENCNVASSVHVRGRGTERNATNRSDDDYRPRRWNGRGPDESTTGKQCRDFGDDCSVPAVDDCASGERAPYRSRTTAGLTDAVRPHCTDARNRYRPGESFSGKRSSENGTPCGRGRWPDAADDCSRDDGRCSACCCCCAGRYGTTAGRHGCAKCSAGDGEPRRKTEDRNANDCGRRPKHRLESVDESAESSNNNNNNNNNNYVGGFLFGNGFHAKPSRTDGFPGEHREDGAKKAVNFSSSTPDGGQHRRRYGYYHDYVPSETGHEDCTVFAGNRISETSGGVRQQQQTPYCSRTERCKNADSSDDSLTDSLEEEEDEEDDDGCCKYEGTAVSYFLALDGQKSAVTFTLKMPTTLESRLNRRQSLLKKHLHVISTTAAARKTTATRVRVRHKGCQTLWTEEKGVQVQRGSTASTAAVRDDHNALRTLLTGLERNAVSENQIRVVGGQKMVSEGNQTERSVEPSSSSSSERRHHVQTQTTGRRDAAVHGPATPKNDAAAAAAAAACKQHAMAKKSSADNALVVGQNEYCKGKEAAAADGAKNREHVLTLSKGWINFYTLRPDSADTEARELDGDNNDIEVRHDDDSQHYTVHVQAVPEPVTLPAVHVPNRNALQLSKTCSAAKHHLPRLVQTDAANNNKNHHCSQSHLANGWCVSVDGPNNVHMKVSLLPDKSNTKTSERFDLNEESKPEARRLALQRKNNSVRRPYRNIKRTQSTPRDMFSADVSRTESALSAESKYIETIDTQLLIHKARRRLSQEWDTRIQNGDVTESVQLVVTGDSVSSKTSQHYAATRGHQHCSFRRQSRRI